MTLEEFIRDVAHDGNFSADVVGNSGHKNPSFCREGTREELEFIQQTLGFDNWRIIKHWDRPTYYIRPAQNKAMEYLSMLWKELCTNGDPHDKRKFVLDVLLQSGWHPR